MALDGTFTILYEFSGGPSGAGPRSIVQGIDGFFYGVTQFGGAFDRGTIFRMMPEGDVTVLYNFSGGLDGGCPISGLTLADDGTFFGTTPIGGSADLGVIFRMTTAGNVTTVHAFEGNNSDGAAPMAGLVLASDGNFYGTTAFGGTGAGTVYRLSASGVFSLLASFGSAGDGALPRASLLRTSDGSLYGTDEPRRRAGFRYRVQDRAERRLQHRPRLRGRWSGRNATRRRTDSVRGRQFLRHDLRDLRDRVLRNVRHGLSDDALGRRQPAAYVHRRLGRPRSGRMRCWKLQDGFLGTTIGGGSHGLGTDLPRHVRRARRRSSTISRADPTDGAQPKSALVPGSDGNFYSTTTRGGSADRGTIFRMTPAGGRHGALLIQGRRRRRDTERTLPGERRQLLWDDVGERRLQPGNGFSSQRRGCIHDAARVREQRWRRPAGRIHSGRRRTPVRDDRGEHQIRGRRGVPDDARRRRDGRRGIVGR